MKLEIPIKVDMKGIDKLIEELKALQTYKLSEGDDMVLLSLDDVVEVFANHVVTINDNADEIKVTNCNDKKMIYEQDAIDIVVFECGKWTGLAKEISKQFKQLPPAQPERKKGKWIWDGDCYICDKCKSAYRWWADSQISNFCPNCGADMRGREHD